MQCDEPVTGSSGMPSPGQKTREWMCGSSPAGLAESSVVTTTPRVVRMRSYVEVRDHQCRHPRARSSIRGESHKCSLLHI
jgi:hypothetical protein